MKNLNTTLTEEDFDTQYTYDETILSDEFDNDSQLGMLETYGTDIKKVIKIANTTPKKVWTMIDGDYGMELVAGYHLCNRIYYVITNENWKDENESYLIQDYSEEN